MAKIFYLGGGTHARGMLRAVASLNQLESLLSPTIVEHVGHEFPLANDPTTLIEISQEEATGAWPAGFCRVAASPADFDKRLRFLPEAATSSEKSKNQPRHNGSGLGHWLRQNIRSGA